MRQDVFVVAYLEARSELQDITNKLNSFASEK